MAAEVWRICIYRELIHQISTCTLYIAVISPVWSCLERLRALPKAVHGHCQMHCQPLPFCRHLICMLKLLNPWFIQLGAARAGCHDIHQSQCVSATHMPGF